MLISLDWIRDFVDLPPDLDTHEIAERFTLTTAEAEGVERVFVDARGLLVARVLEISELDGTRNLRRVILDIGDGHNVETVSAAPSLHIGCNVVYAPPGASLAALGELGRAEVAGVSSAGMIIPADAVGIKMAPGEAVFIDDSVAPGEALPAELFDDWLIEIDNKSLTNRPDLWGHYGIARELAAIYELPLKPYPVAPLEELQPDGEGEVGVSIAAPDACRRYSALVLEGVPMQPAPLWMQLRLGRVGMRPISGLVDTTNYIMADLGQPTHAFDAGKVNSIEVDWAGPTETFQTLDGMERQLPPRTLMIQCGGRSVAIAGIMGGLETEVSESTTALLLESANFEPATIRRAANGLGLRTDASARFEKSLDPANTLLAIRRFLELARPMYPNLSIKSRLSDCYPHPAAPITVSVNPERVARLIGRPVETYDATRILEPLGFEMTTSEAGWHIRVPSYRATNDISLEVDIVEELARYIGYGSIEPTMPRVTVRRFEPNALHELEQRTLDYFTSVHGFHEIQGYLWYDASWFTRLSIDPGPCVELKNPAAEGLEKFRRTLLPGLLAAVERNRFHFPALAILELGTVFERNTPQDDQYRQVGLMLAKRGKNLDSELYGQIKGMMTGWAWQRFGRTMAFAKAAAHADRPWEHAERTATVLVDDRPVGRVSVVDRTFRRSLDEHLTSWSIVWAELRLSGLEALGLHVERLGTIPAFPLVELDTSFLVPATTSYCDVVGRLASFEHSLLKSFRFVDSYEGGAIPAGRRSLTFRAVVGDDARTLIDADTNDFRNRLQLFLDEYGYEVRR